MSYIYLLHQIKYSFVKYNETGRMEFYENNDYYNHSNFLIY
jgi:hypothetical protein